MKTLPFKGHNIIFVSLNLKYDKTYIVPQNKNKMKIHFNFNGNGIMVILEHIFIENQGNNL